MTRFEAAETVKMYQYGVPNELPPHSFDLNEETVDVILNALEERPCVTVNQFVCLFPSGTRIKVHVIFADEAETERNKDRDFGVWGDGEYYGITRYSIGACPVRDARILKPLIKNHRYDIDIWAYEPDFSKKLREKWEKKE